MNKIKIFSDGAVIDDIIAANQSDTIQGITTNPTLMAKAGIKNYLDFCKDALKIVKHKSFSLEVFSDEPNEIERQARLLSNLANNVYVKIPIVNSVGRSTLDSITKLSSEGIKINVTAVFTFTQIKDITTALNKKVPSYISIFAGRIADAGQDPEPFIRFCAENKNKNHEIIWASPREVFNVLQAQRSGAEIITATPDIIKKIKNFGKDLHEYSIETSKMFYDDAIKSKFNI